MKEKDVRRQKLDDGRWKKKEDTWKQKRQCIGDSKALTYALSCNEHYCYINTVNIELKLQKKTIVKGILGMLSYEWILYSIKQNEIT